MKQLTCEMCGSNELVKQDGVFVCQACGAKYSTEEAKKMMIEGSVAERRIFNFPVWCFGKVSCGKCRQQNNPIGTKGALLYSYDGSMCLTAYHFDRLSFFLSPYSNIPSISTSASNFPSLNRTVLISNFPKCNVISAPYAHSVAV